MMATTFTTATALSERINRIEISGTLAVVNEAAKLREQGMDLADLGCGEPHFATPEHIKAAAIEAIRSNLTKYTHVAGTTELRDAICRRHGADFATGYKVDECLATAGGKMALFSALEVLVETGDEVIIPVPYWVSFKDIVRYAGGSCVFVECDEEQGFRLTPEMVERALTPRTKAIILNSPNNPSGAVIREDDLRAIVRLAAERGIYVLSDECYVYLNHTGARVSVASFAGVKDKVVVLGSLSKTYAMTGWRLGYALGPKDVIGAMQKLQSQTTSNPTTFVQKAAVTALNGSQQCVADMRADYLALRERMIAGLRQIPGINMGYVPEGAFYVYPNVSAFFGRSGVATAGEIASRLLGEANVVTVPGEAFGTERHIRLSYATSAAVIDRALERMQAFFSRL